MIPFLFLFAGMIGQGCTQSNNKALSAAEKGRILLEKNQFREAITEFDLAIEANPKDALAYYDRGVAYERIEKLDQAVADYTSALALNPKEVRAINNRAVVHIRRKKPQEAIADFTQAIKLAPHDAVCLRNRGLAYHELGKIDEAIADFTQAIKIDRSAPQGYMLRANSLMAQKKFTPAVADFSEVIKLDPRNATAFVGRANALRELKRPAEAIADLDQARKIDPNSVPAPPPPQLNPIPTGNQVIARQMPTRDPNLQPAGQLGLPWSKEIAQGISAQLADRQIKVLEIPAQPQQPWLIQLAGQQRAIKMQIVDGREMLQALLPAAGQTPTVDGVIILTFEVSASNQPPTPKLLGIMLHHTPASK